MDHNSIGIWTREEIKRSISAVARGHRNVATGSVEQGHEGGDVTKLTMPVGEV